MIAGKITVRYIYRAKTGSKTEAGNVDIRYTVIERLIEQQVK